MAGLKFHVQNQILFVDFFRPQAGNSFGEQDGDALKRILSKMRDDIRGLLWTSPHPALFCSGGDLKNHNHLNTKKDGLKQAEKISRVLSTLAEWPVPKAVFVQGDCYGGGLELLSCFDFRVAAPHVLFGFWQRRIGLSFGWGGFERWSSRISADTLKQLTQSARVFGAAEARRFGVINEIGTVQSTLRWLEETQLWSPESGEAVSSLEKSNEKSLFRGLWWTEAHRSAIRKFSKKS